MHAKLTKPIRVNDGQVSLTYKFGQANCHGAYYRKAIVNFVCDRSAKAPSENSLIFVQETEQCVYIFELMTSLACSDRVRNLLQTSQILISVDRSSRARLQTPETL